MAYTKKKMNGMYVYIYTPPCHLEKPAGTSGQEFMIEQKKVAMCLVCRDNKRCWDGDTLNQKIAEEYKEQEKQLEKLVSSRLKITTRYS